MNVSLYNKKKLKVMHNGISSYFVHTTQVIALLATYGRHGIP